MVTILLLLVCAYCTHPGLIYPIYDNENRCLFEQQFVLIASKGNEPTD